MIDFNYTLLIQFVNFLILLILLNFLLFKPVLRAMSKREGTINSLADRIQKAKEEMNVFEKEYEEKVREQKKPIIADKDSTIAEAHTVSMHIIEKARAELSGELERVKSEIEGESKKVFDSLKTDVKRLSTEVAQKILQRSLS
ncbi:MAG: ATP synthase F0 subunit B [Syntrophorhabdaceae bacterium]|nr:ATP synthase F0 subunit B [Syntrophorhabdaceae bacterium]MDD5244025.1 ATP synthase F0 subunit B [Syntrophorhabdaceae bacterium]